MTAKPRIESARNVAIPKTNRKLGRSSFARGRTSANASDDARPARHQHGRLRQVVHEVRRGAPGAARSARAGRARAPSGSCSSTSTSGRRSRASRSPVQITGATTHPDDLGRAREPPVRPQRGKARKRRQQPGLRAQQPGRREQHEDRASRAAASRPPAPPPTRAAPGTGRRCSRARPGSRSPAARAAAARRPTPTTSPKIALAKPEAADHERDEPRHADADDGRLPSSPNSASTVVSATHSGCWVGAR